MHAWTSYLAVLVYALHAIYLSLKVLFTPTGITAHEYNESAATAEQRRDLDYNGAIYRPTPNYGLFGWRRRHTDIDAVNAARGTGTTGATLGETTAVGTGAGVEPHRISAGAAAGPTENELAAHTVDPALTGASHTAHPAHTHPGAGLGTGAAGGVGVARPRWSERALLFARDFFLVPRAKWAVASLFGMSMVVLMGLAAQQIMLAAGSSAYITGATPTNNRLSERSTETWWINALGLAVMLAALLIGYAAMPPRTVLDRAAVAGAMDNTFIDRRSSTSTATTAQNSATGGVEGAVCTSITV